MHRVAASGWGCSGAPRLRATVGEHHGLVLRTHERLEMRAREDQAAHARPLRAAEEQAAAHHAASIACVVRVCVCVCVCVCV